VAGVTLGVYVILISLSGSAAVFRRDLATSLMPPGEAVGGRALAIALMEWCADFHDNLAAGDAGRTLNGYAAIAFTLLIPSGTVLCGRAAPTGAAASSCRARVAPAASPGTCTARSPSGASSCARLCGHRHLLRLP
jgi:uncharacterized iron-regulated membrane protein